MNNPAQIIISKPDAGGALSAVGDVYRVLATGEQTSGAYALCEAVIHPNGGPPLHWHTREEESFFVLEGEIIFTVGLDQVVARPGTFLQVPRETKHTFKNLSGHKARMLIQTTPAGFEKFMAEFAQPVVSLDAAPLPVTSQDIQRLLETAPRYGIHICPPEH